MSLEEERKNSAYITKENNKNSALISFQQLLMTSKLARLTRASSFYRVTLF